MGTFLVYILKSAVCLAMFYLFYRLLLSKETFHRFNRMALLGVMLLSCLLPLVKVTVEQASPVNAQVMSMEDLLLYNPQIQISAESETKRSIFREKDKTKRSKKESAQHSKSRNKSFVMTSVSAL